LLFIFIAFAVTGFVCRGRGASGLEVSEFGRGLPDLNNLTILLTFLSRGRCDPRDLKLPIKVSKSRQECTLFLQYNPFLLHTFILIESEIN